MLNYAYLRDIYKEESSNSQLTKIDPNFYSEVKRIIIEKKGSNDYNEISEGEKMLKLLKRILIKRREKLLLLSLLDKINEDYLTEEEKKFMHNLKKAYLDAFNEIELLINGKNVEIKKEKNEGILKVSIKIIKQVEAYKGLDDNIYGPFSEGDIVELPKKEAEWLLQAKFAEKV